MVSDVAVKMIFFSFTHTQQASTTTNGDVDHVYSNLPAITQVSHTYS